MSHHIIYSLNSLAIGLNIQVCFEYIFGKLNNYNICCYCYKIDREDGIRIAKFKMGFQYFIVIR